MRARSDQESEKHQEPRNQVPEEGSKSEEGFTWKSCIENVKHIITYHSINEFHLSIYWRVFPDTEGTSLMRVHHYMSVPHKSSSLIEAASVEEAVKQNEVALLNKNA